MNTEIFYVVSICISGEIFLEDQKVGKYGPDRNQGQLFLFLRKKIIKAISVKVNSIVTNAQSIDGIASGAGIKILLLA